MIDCPINVKFYVNNPKGFLDKLIDILSSPDQTQQLIDYINQLEDNDLTRELKNQTPRNLVSNTYFALVKNLKVAVPISEEKASCIAYRQVILEFLTSYYQQFLETDKLNILEISDRPSEPLSKSLKLEKDFITDESSESTEQMAEKIDVNILESLISSSSLNVDGMKKQIKLYRPSETFSGDKTEAEKKLKSIIEEEKRAGTGTGSGGPAAGGVTF